VHQNRVAGRHSTPTSIDLDSDGFVLDDEQELKENDVEIRGTTTDAYIVSTRTSSFMIVWMRTCANSILHIELQVLVYGRFMRRML